MGKVDYIVVEASYAGLELISSFIQKKCALTNLSFKKTWELMLTIDEICSIILTCKTNEPNIIKVSWQDINNTIKIEIMDDGTPFNPLTINPEEDDDYGFGFNLIKEMVDYVEYKRENGYNIVIIKKNRKKWKK
ncbi:MAG: ATP-binding protein [Candidatus Omnitrophica bacterium]|nr:ATP-binding protein [Candidatus Omnitrophota bacterium]